MKVRPHPQPSLAPVVATFAPRGLLGEGTFLPSSFYSPLLPADPRSESCDHRSKTQGLGGMRWNCYAKIAFTNCMGYRPIFIIFLAVSITAGCASSTDSANGPLVYNREYSGNVSTFYGPLGRDRTGLNDNYAPEFYWRNSSGVLDSLTGQRGKIVLLNFWATWCGYCVNEMPELQAIAQEMADTVVVIGVSVDNTGDAFTKVRDFSRSNNYTYQMVMDSDYTLYYKYLLDYQAGIPQSFVIDANGNIGPPISGEQSKEVFLRAINDAR